MDPHFHEYLAAIAGMHDVYGDRPDEHMSEFHDDLTAATGREPVATGAAA